jgi:hypothetical protein
MENYSSDFSQVFDQCLKDIQTGQATIEECLQRYPELRAQLEPQLRLAVRLRAGHVKRAPAQMHLAGWADLQDQLKPRSRPSAHKTIRQIPFPVSEPANGRVYRPKGMPSRAERRPAGLIGRLSMTVAVLVVMILVLLSSGVVYASSQSLPGQAFYPLKIALEQVQLRTVSGDLRRTAMHLDQASRRLDELDSLPDLSEGELVDRVLIDYTDHVTAVLEYVALLGEINDLEQVDFAQRITLELSRNEERLNRIRPRVGALNQSWLDNALAASTVGLRYVEYILEKSPLMQSPNLAEFYATATARSTQPILAPTQPAGQEQPATATPTPTPTFNPAATAVVWSTPDPLEWLDLLPSRPRLATIWATIYPTLSDLATRLPSLSGTPRPVIRPTQVKPTLIPTQRP